MTTTRQTQMLVYGGTTDGDKRQYLYLPITADENNGESVEDTRQWFIYKKPLKVGLLVGTIVTCEIDEKGSTYLATVRAVGAWKNAADIKSWEARHRAAETRRSMQAETAKQLYTVSLERKVDELASVYRELSSRNKRALLAWIIDRITN